jgi:hypothetical protein
MSDFKPVHRYSLNTFNNALCMLAFCFSVLALVVAVVAPFQAQTAIPPTVEYALIRQLVNMEADNWKYMQLHGDSDNKTKADKAMAFARKLQDDVKQKVNYPH